MDAISFLVDENVPAPVTTFLKHRGHTVYAVAESFTKSSPDALLLSAAEVSGFVILTFDKDFKSLIRQFPSGTRTRAERRADRISCICKETGILRRLNELIDVIEFQYAFAIQHGKRFVMQISGTSFTIAG